MSDVVENRSHIVDAGRDPEAVEQAGGALTYAFKNDLTVVVVDQKWMD